MEDFLVHNHGSVVLLDPVSQAAKEWVEEHLPSERMSWGGAVVVEPRYLGNIVEGARQDGLIVA